MGTAFSCKRMHGATGGGRGAAGAEGAAISFLMSDAIQDEIANIIAAAQATSLDGERKIYQDKKAGEITKVTGLARFSRNSILTHYRKEHKTARGHDMKARQEE